MEAIWAGSSSFSAGNTPYGFYDSDTEFSGSGNHSIDKFSDWAAKRLGYPIIEVELQDKQFYACYEEAITEYSAQVNQFNIRDNMLALQGQETGSGATKTNLTHTKVTPTLGTYIRLAEQYGTEAGVGGSVTLKTGSISVNSGSQVYDLQELWDATHPQVKELSSDFHITDYSVEHHWDYNFKDVGNSSIYLMGNFV